MYQNNNNSKQLPADSPSFTNTVDYILDQDYEYFSSIYKTLTLELATQISQLLFQQREELKKFKLALSEKLNDSKTEAERYKNQIASLKDHAKLLEQECENFRNLLTNNEHENERKYNELSQSSICMREEYEKELKKQRDNNQELTILIHELKCKANEIKKLENSIARLGEEMQSYKKYKDLNTKLTQEIFAAEQKLSNAKVSEREYKEKYQRMQENMSILEERNQELEYIVNNQIPRIKQMLAEGLGSNSVPQQKRSRNHEENMEFLKDVQQNFDSEYMVGSQKAKRVKKNAAHNKGSIPVRNRLNDNDQFENSLDNISQNWDEISLKQIQASSKSKNFNENIFDIRENQNESSSKESKNLSKNDEYDPFQQINLKQLKKPLLQSIQKNRQLKQSASQFKTQLKKPIKKFNSAQQQVQGSNIGTNLQVQIVPLSINRYSTHKRYDQSSHPKSDESSPHKEFDKSILNENKLQNAPKKMRIPKIFNIPSGISQKIETPPVSLSRSQTSRGENQIISSPRSQMNYEKSIKNHSQYRRIITPQPQILQFNNSHPSKTTKQIELLRQKLKDSQARIQKLEQQLLSLGATRQSQINLFRDQFQAQNKMIEKMDKEIQQLKEENLNYMEENRKKEKQNVQKIDKMEKEIRNYKKIIAEQEKMMGKEKQTTKELEDGQSKQIQIKTQDICESKIEIINEKEMQAQISVELKQQAVQTSIQKIIRNLQFFFEIIQMQVANPKIQALGQSKSRIQPNFNSIQLKDYKEIQVNSHYHHISPFQQNQQQNIGHNILKRSNKKEPNYEQFELNEKSNTLNSRKWPIKEFKPTPEVQQIRQQTSSSIIQEQNQVPLHSDRGNTQGINFNMGESQMEVHETIYYSFDTIDLLNLEASGTEIQKDLLNDDQSQQPVVYKKIEGCRKNCQKSKQFDTLVSLQMIISSAWNKLGKSKSNNTLPNLSNLKTAPKFSFSQIISRNKNNPNNLKQFYLLSALLSQQSQLTPDKVLLWKQGIASLKQGGCLLMSGLRKYIFDPINWILGNCQIILDREGGLIQIRREGKKNYFTGQLRSHSWKVLEVEGFGIY